MIDCDSTLLSIPVGTDVCVCVIIIMIINGLSEINCSPRAENVTSNVADR